MSKVLTEEDVGNLFKFHDLKYTNRKIAKELGIHHKTVAGYLARDNRVPNGPPKTNIMFIDEDLIKCTRCQFEYPKSFFQKGRAGTSKEYLFSYCNNCRRTQMTQNLHSNIDKFLADRVRRKIRYCSTHKISCNITKEYIIELWTLQKGLCFYTDVPLTWSEGRESFRESISIDRVDCTGGYTIGNVVLCSNRVNTMKSDATLEEMSKWMPDWYARICKRDF